jgi:hypothetical protein
VAAPQKVPKKPTTGTRKGARAPLKNQDSKLQINKAATKIVKTQKPADANSNSVPSNKRNIQQPSTQQSKKKRKSHRRPTTRNHQGNPDEEVTFDFVADPTKITQHNVSIHLSSMPFWTTHLAFHNPSACTRNPNGNHPPIPSPMDSASNTNISRPKCNCFCKQCGTINLLPHQH